MQGAERTNRHRANLVGLPHLQVSESKFSLVALILRGALDLTDTMHRLRGPKQGHGPQGAGAGTPLAVDLQRDDVTHVVGVAVRQYQGVKLARAHVRPQRPKRTRSQVAHERKHAFPARLGVDAARLNEVGGCGGLRPRHRACRTNDGQLHAIPPPVLTRTTDPTSGPRKRLARRGKASDAPVARN